MHNDCHRKFWLFKTIVVVFQEARCKHLQMSEVSTVWPLHVRMQGQEKIHVPYLTHKGVEKSQSRTASAATAFRATTSQWSWKEEEI
jgi:hypothetical protein